MLLVLGLQLTSCVILSDLHHFGVLGHYALLISIIIIICLCVNKKNPRSSYTHLEVSTISTINDVNEFSQ